MSEYFGPLDNLAKGEMWFNLSFEYDRMEE